MRSAAYIGVHHPSLMPAPQAIDAQKFFADLAPRILARRKGHRSGTVAFRIEGPRGGAWQLDLDRGEITSIEASSNASIAMSDRDFAALARGTLDIPRAVKEQRISAEGDREALVALAAILKP